MKPVGRNDPCPCGSGLKYKHCHGRPQKPVPVLYIHPAKQGVDFYEENLGSKQVNMGRPYGLMPMGLPAIVNRLRENDIEVRGVIYPAEKKINAGFDIRAWLRSNSTAKLVLIDMHWYEHTYGAISMAQVVKQVLPKATVVMGGLSASGFAEDILAEFDAVDVIIRGDGEGPMLQLAQALLAAGGDLDAVDLAAIANLSYRTDEGVVSNTLSYCAATEDLDALNYADIDFLEHSMDYYMFEYIVTDIPAARAAMESKNPFYGRWVATARGCKYECSYCGGARSAHKVLAGRNGIIPRSPDAVVKEIVRLAEMGLHQVSLSYDIAELGDRYWRKFFSLLRKSGVKIGLYNEFFQLPPSSFIKDFVRSVDIKHSCLALSPLSGNERVRRLNGKHYSDAEMTQILDYLLYYNVPIFVYFSLNLPGETLETVDEAIALAESIYNQYPPKLVKIINSLHSLDPLCPIQQHPEKFGVEEVSFNSFKDFYAYCRETQAATDRAREGYWRGFKVSDERFATLKAMSDKWDAAREGKEESWWPIPPSW